MGPDSGAVGESENDGYRGVTPGPEPEPTHVTDDLVEGRIDETVELDLGYRAGTGQGHTNGGANDPGLIQRRVDDPFTPVLLVQTLGNPEDATGDTDVLAQDDHPRVGLHRLVKGGVYRLGHSPRLTWTVRCRVVADPPDFVFGELSLGLVVGPLHGVQLLDDMFGDAMEPLTDRIVA